MRTSYVLLMSLAASTSALAGERVHIVREVPSHDVSLLADCPQESAAGIEHEIAVAISLGAPTYNEGNFEGCYRVYSNAALAIDAREKACTGVRKALLKGVAKAGKVRTFDEKAWAMRDAFDGVLDVIERGRNDAPAPVAVERHVPRFPIRSLDDCAGPSRAAAIKAINDAIEVGAPLFNDGNVEACARVYVGAASELQSDLPACTRVKKALGAAVDAARAERDPGVKAWKMRDTFDGLLEVMTRKVKGTSDEI